MIRPYLRDIINDHKTQGKWKVHSGNDVIDYKTQREQKTQLIMVINFISSKDSGDICNMGTKTRNIENVMRNEKNKTTEELFEPLLQKYQERLKVKMRGSNFFYSAELQHDNLHKVGGLDIDSRKWLKSKKATINHKNNDDLLLICYNCHIKL